MRGRRFVPEGDAFVLFAAKGGHPRNPAWLHNLRANPDAEVQVGTRRMRVRAREAEGQERARLWPRAARYRAIRLLVDESSSADGADDPVSLGASWLAITLPSSTPHWSNELICQMVPSVNVMCS